METHRVPDKDQNCSKEALQATEELRPLNEIKKILHEWNKKSSKEIEIMKNNQKQSKRHSGAQGYDDWKEKCGRELQHQT